MLKQTLRLQDYEVWVHLGCTADEQSFTQPVHFTIQLDFHSDTQAVNSDQLTDAVDYVQLASIVKEVAEKKFYHLVEHLCYEVSLKICDFLKEKLVQGTLTVQVHKLRVPVENLRNGVVFTCTATL